jgi:hypothetical protein
MKRFFMAGPWMKVTASNGVDTGAPRRLTNTGTMTEYGRILEPTDGDLHRRRWHLCGGV